MDVIRKITVKDMVENAIDQVREQRNIKESVADFILPDLENAGEELETYVSLVREALVNVICNGIEAYSNPPGKVWVKSEMKEVNGKACVCISVRDEGMGISHEDLESIHNPSYSKNKDRGGGLGLFIVDLACKAAGIRNTVESEVGKGTTYNFLIPRKFE